MSRRSLRRHAHAHARMTPRHTTTTTTTTNIRAQDHNTFTRNDAGPGLSSAGAAPTTLVTLGLTRHPASSPSAQVAKRLARRRRPRARRPLRRRRRRPPRRRWRPARSPSRLTRSPSPSLKLQHPEAPGRAAPRFPAHCTGRRSPPPQAAGGPAGTSRSPTLSGSGGTARPPPAPPPPSQLRPPSPPPTNRAAYVGVFAESRDRVRLHRPCSGRGAIGSPAFAALKEEIGERLASSATTWAEVHESAK